MVFGEFLAYATSLFKVTPDYVIGNRRYRHAVYVRHAIFMALRQRGWSYPRIARKFNYKCHSTVIHGCERAEYNMQRDPNYRKKVEAMVAFSVIAVAPSVDDTPETKPEPQYNEWGLEITNGS